MSVRARQSLILGWLVALSLAACAHTSAESDVAVRQYNKIQLLPVTVLPNGTINRSPERVQAHVVVDYVDGIKVERTFFGPIENGTNVTAMAEAQTQPSKFETDLAKK